MAKGNSIKTCLFCKQSFKFTPTNQGYCSVKCRFWSKVDIRGQDECWNWIASCGSHKYGQMMVNGKEDLAHRISWLLTYGENPAHLDVLHKCDNPPCVNPLHLFLGTAKDNAIDMVRKGRQNCAPLRGEQVSNSKLTTKKVKEIRDRLAKGHKLSDIAKSFGVSYYTIWDVRKGRHWFHIPGAIPYKSKPRRKLNKENIQQIRQLLSSGEKQWRIAQRFNVKCKTISDINCRKTWVYVN
jgi:hypothetical protein